ncbi:MAG: DUF1343 domain-containing protein [Bacteroidota bacterium]
MNRSLIVLSFVCCSCALATQKEAPQILPGAYQTEAYLPLLRGKSVGLTVNHSSMIGEKHLIDTLKRHKVQVAKVFTPEHGFRGTVSDGITIDYTDSVKSFELISLYGKNKKPSSKQLSGIDMMVFDLQDVGARFYTYISTMHYIIEACAEKKVPLLILDRPNPNGSYIDGPVLDTTHRSFVGMHPIPIVYGMTIGELALMINGEDWINTSQPCDLRVIKVQNWDHQTSYSLPIRPSPNLPNDLSISLYPSLCLFEGTIMSVGRGTEYPFQQIGHPGYPDQGYSFTPISWEGSKYPPFEGKRCFGKSWNGEILNYALDLKPLLETYHKMSERNEEFFNDYFNLLAGTDELKEQIKSGLDEAAIKKSWEPGLENFKKIRDKYLLY